MGLAVHSKSMKETKPCHGLWLAGSSICSQKIGLFMTWQTQSQGMKSGFTLFALSPA